MDSLTSAVAHTVALGYPTARSPVSLSMSSVTTLVFITRRVITHSWETGSSTAIRRHSWGICGGITGRKSTTSTHRTGCSSVGCHRNLLANWAFQQSLSASLMLLNYFLIVQFGSDELDS